MKTIYMLLIAVIVVGAVMVLVVNKPAKQSLALAVNDENCKVENMLKIEDSKARQDFLGKCQAFAAAKKPLLPEVNAENCQPENVVKIEDMTARQDFREKCEAAASAQLRSGKFVPSQNKGYGF